MIKKNTPNMHVHQNTYIVAIKINAHIGLRFQVLTKEDNIVNKVRRVLSLLMME